MASAYHSAGNADAEADSVGNDGNDKSVNFVVNVMSELSCEPEIVRFDKANQNTEENYAHDGDTAAVVATTLCNRVHSIVYVILLIISSPFLLRLKQSIY